MKYFIKIIKESIIVIILTSLIGMLTGSFLSFNENILYTIPIILLLLPALNSLIGDISTVLSSRLTSHLYIGSLSPKIQGSHRLKEDFLGLLITILLSLISLIVIGYSMGIITGIHIINPFLIFIILLITITSLFCILFIFIFMSAIILFKRGKDPNNFLIPFVTSLADFLTPFFLIIFITIFI
ncbi:MAG: magnesium transporter [Promethearchaeota archaeon]